MKKLYTLFLLLFSLCCAAQSEKTPDIPLVRKYFHENIDATQENILALRENGKGWFTSANDETLNQQLTYALTNKVDSLQNMIELDSSLDNNNKIKYLRGLNEVLVNYKNYVARKTIKASLLTDLLNAYRDALVQDVRNESIENIIAKYSYALDDILLKSIAFSNNTGIEACRQILVLKYCIEFPDKIMIKLSENPDMPFTDSLVKVYARHDPDNLYTFAAAYNKLGQKIHNNPDSLVQIISKISRMNTGRQYFPFLDNLYRGKISFDDINTAMSDSAKYYSLLVQTEIDYANRIRMKDTPLAMPILTARLAFKAKEVYVNVINGLHESPDNIRFKIIDKLSPQELYYLAVLCEEEIYTSSYVRGVYPRIFQKKNLKADTLLMQVYFDHFKKWIKMAANYNTLDDFLSRMNNENAQLLMKAFVNGLDKTNSLEDAVDVANSFASISGRKLRELILRQVQYNLQQASQTQNKRATDIYSILNTLFLSIDSSNHINVSAALGIPPVYFMPNKLMRDTSGKIIIQQFFYGDKDGQLYFNLFLNTFKNAGWKISMANEWAVVSSTKGIPVIIYSNKPLDEKQNLDDKAQQDLSDYLADHDLQPTFVIHRGHSYYLNSTLKRLSPSAKVILLGSCGGYQSLNTVLKTCPTAQIIASKQTGAGALNQPMISSLTEILRSGKDLDWPKIWGSYSKTFSHNLLFDDYVPPHKNLGAVFIMAYQKKQDDALAQ